MMVTFLLALCFLILLFVAFWQLSMIIASMMGAPSVYAFDQAIEDAFKLAKLKPGQTVVDLGCGNAKSLIIAAKKYGANGVGVERSPYCFLLACWRVFVSGQGGRVKIVYGDFKRLEQELRRANVVYLYLLNSVLIQIEPWLFRLIGSHTRVVALAFQFKDHKPVNQVETYNLHRKTVVRLYEK